MGGVNTDAAWAGIGEAFGKPSMEAILNCRVPIKLNKIWDKTSKLNTGGSAASQELSAKYGKGDKESVSTGGLLHHKDNFVSMEGTSVSTRSRWKRRKLVAKELGKAYKNLNRWK